MNQLRSKIQSVSQGTSNVCDPVTPVPLCESIPIIRPSLSMKQRGIGDSSTPLIHRNVQIQRELMDRVSEKGEPFCPEVETNRNQRIGWVYLNEKQLVSVELLYSVIIQYFHAHRVFPGCLCVSLELQDTIKRDMEALFGEAFLGTIPFPSGQREIHSIRVHFLSDLSRDYVMGYDRDCFS